MRHVNSQFILSLTIINPYKKHCLCLENTVNFSTNVSESQIYQSQRFQPACLDYAE